MASKEIIDFMTAGSNKKKKKNSSNRLTPSPSVTDRTSPTLLPSPSSPRRQISFGLDWATAASSSPSANSKRKHHTSSILSAFVRTMQQWLDTDEDAERVAALLANLRLRLWHTSTMLLQHQHHRSTKLNDNDDDDHHGNQYRLFSSTSSSPSSLMTQDDLQLALDHDLVQHEHALAQLRKLLAAVGETQDALGRRLDELYRHVLLQQGSTNREDCMPMVTTAAAAAESSLLTLNECQAMVHATARELYRKQTLAERVFVSGTTASLLNQGEVVAAGPYGARAAAPAADDSGNENSNSSSSSRQVAQRCWKEWSWRTSRHSELLDVAKLLDKMIVNK
jgi:hypothetical protein